MFGMDQDHFHTNMDSPLGPLWLMASKTHLLAVTWDEVEMKRWGSLPRETDLLRRAIGQLKEYFQGQRQVFDLPLLPGGTEFQNQVWKELRQIPFGQTITYGEQARRMGRPTASRAVGAANGKNPLPIVIPCHRVIGTNRNLTGYAGGLDRKRTLLALEGTLP